MLIAVITWSSLVLALLALGGAAFGIVEMRKEDALRAARGKSIVLISVVVAVLFFALFGVGLYRLRVSSRAASANTTPQTQAPPDQTSELTPRDRDNETGGGTVQPPKKTSAEILFVSPPEGVRGRIVTIVGKGFGTSHGTVQFLDAKGITTPAKLVASSECTPTPWSESTILFVVPDLPPAEYKVGVALADGTQLASTPFRITNLGTRTSICRLDPEHGVPETTTMTIVGDELGETPGKVLFGTVPATNVLTWSARAVSIRIPRGAATGTVRVVTAAGVRSNDLAVTIGQCTSTSCRSGETCCGDGACRKEGSCPTTGACRYRWYFTTGTTFALPCGADGKCPSGFTCNAATQRCVPGARPEGPCTTNAQCSSGAYCQRSTGKCLDGTPYMIEESGCTNTVQSPTPYRGRIDACTNARFGARFSVPMDATTFDNAVELSQCGTKNDFDPMTCTLRVQGTLDTIPGQDGPQGFLFRSAATLQPETWYSMLVRKTLRSSVGIPLDRDQTWYVRTGKTSCALDHIEVVPERSVVVGVDSQQLYRALPTTTNCNVVPHAGPWNWVSKDETRVALNPKIEEETGAIARAVTQPEGVTLEAELEKKRDRGILVVRLDAPKLLAWWPACAAACRNAELGLRFSVPMRMTSVTEKTIRLEACGDPTCKAVTPVPLTGFSGQEGNAVVVFRPAKGVLAPGMTYRMVLVASQLMSRDGATLAGIASGRSGDVVIAGDRYSWTFRTLDTRAVCTVDHVSVAPATAILDTIFAKQDFAAVPRGKGDACDRDGQRIIASGLLWNWASSQEQVAQILPDANLQDASVNAEARGSGQSAISAETGGARGLGTLSVVCNATSDQSCGAGRGVGIDRCCYPRPKLVIKKPEGAGACRNGVVQLIFDQPMDPKSVEQGVVIEQEVAGTTCGTTKAPKTAVKNAKTFCSLAVTATASGDGRIISLMPKNTLPKDASFRVRVAGRESTTLPSVKNRAGVALEVGSMWNFTTGALICQITSIRVYRDPLPDSIQGETFLCARRDNCTDDTSSTKSGNQHRLRAEALDQEGKPVGATYTWNSRNRRIADITPNNGEAEVTAGENGSTALELVAVGTSTGGGKGNVVLPMDVTACENPWPPKSVQGTGTLWEPFADKTGTSPTNFSTWYCRDRGDPQIEDDLPALTWPPTLEVGFEQDPKKRDLLKGFLMQVQGGGEEDAIGIEVFRNTDQQSLASWYAQQFSGSGQGSAPAPATIDGYPSLRDGRTLYVHALNVVGNTVFTNIYLLAFGLGASEDTVAIAKQLEENLRFTTTVTDKEERAKLQRDVTRLQALRSMRDALERYKASHGGALPKLEAGSFIPGLTFSTWPLSWGRLGGIVGGSFAGDPVNRFEGCAKPYDPATCWNPVRKKGDPLVKQFKCPSKAFAYGYKVDPGSPGGYMLAANFEYDGSGSLKRDPLYRSLDSLLGSGVCTK